MANGFVQLEASRATVGAARQTAHMKTLGIWLSLLGAASVVWSSGWVTFTTWKEHRALATGADRADKLVSNEQTLENALRDGWGHHAVSTNYEETRYYKPDPELDRLRKTYLQARAERVKHADGWVVTYGDMGTPRKRVEKLFVDSAWTSQKWQGFVALVGGVAAFVGAILTAAAG